MAITLNDYQGKGAEKSAPLNTMKITILKSTRLNGLTKLAGSIVDLELPEAKFLINTGVAVETKEKAKVKKSDKATKSSEVNHRD